MKRHRRKRKNGTERHQIIERKREGGRERQTETERERERAMAKESWADDVEEEDKNAAKAAGGGDPTAADALAKEITEKVAVKDPNEGEERDDQDQPDTSLKSDKLNESSDGVERKLADDVQTPYKSAKSFKELGLKENLLEGIFNVMKFEKPSKIQAETLPMILEPPHRNLIAQAHNGSGKTTCFVLGMLSLVDPEVKLFCFSRSLPLSLSLQHPTIFNE